VPLTAAPRAEAVVADGHVFVALQSGVVVAHRAADGIEAWRVELLVDQPVAAEGNLVFVSSGEAVHALRTRDGAVAWRTPTGTITAPLLAQDGWIIASAGTQLIALRAADGTIIWKRDFPPAAARPSIEGDRLYVPRADGRVQSLVLATGADRWTRRLGGEPTEVLAFADRVFVGSADRHFYALDAGDGSIAWRYRVGADLRGRPAAEGAFVFAAALDNLVRGFDRHNGERKWQEGVPYRPTAGPLVVGSSLIVSGSARELPSFNPRTGAPATKLALTATLAAPLTAASLAEGPVLVALAGDGAVGWSVSLLQAAFGMRVAPLTALPGEVVPIRIPPPPK
jgi:outer membrane protein assembly factor BamB